MPTGPLTWPTATSARGRGQPEPAAPDLVVVAGELDPEAERLGVHPVGPARHQGEPVADRLGGERRLEGRGVLVDLAGGVTKLGGQGGVDDVGGGEPQVEVATLVADRLLDRLDEGGDVVALLGLQLGDPGWVDPGARPQLPRRLRGNPSDGRPALGGQQLHLQPPPEPGFVAEDGGDRGRGVTGDHVGQFYSVADTGPESVRPSSDRGGRDNSRELPSTFLPILTGARRPPRARPGASSSARVRRAAVT